MGSDFFTLFHNNYEISALRLGFKGQTLNFGLW